MAVFPYVSFDRNGKKFFKPLVPVVLKYKPTHKIIPATYALIDSGADVCLCSTQIGKYLRINFKKIKTKLSIVSVNGSISATKPATVHLYIANKIYPCVFYFSDRLPKETPIILGQSGFFTRFKVTFDTENEKILIT